MSQILGEWVDYDTKGKYPFAEGLYIFAKLPKNISVSKVELPDSVKQRCEGKISSSLLDLLARSQSFLKLYLKDVIDERQAMQNQQGDPDEKFRRIEKILKKSQNKIPIPVHETARVVFCFSVETLAREFLLKSGKSPSDVIYVQGSYFPTSKHWRPHAYLVIRDGDQNYFVDSTQTLSATQRNWLPTISALDAENYRKLKDGKEVIGHHLINGSPVIYSRNLELSKMSEMKQKGRMFLQELIEGRGISQKKSGNVR